MSTHHQPKECFNCGSVYKLILIPLQLSSIKSSIIACLILFKFFQLLKEGEKNIDIQVDVDYKTKLIHLSSFKMQFLSYCYNSQAEIQKDDSQLGCVSQKKLVWQKDQYSSRYGFPKFVVLLIDSILGVNLVDIFLRFLSQIVSSKNLL